MSSDSCNHRALSWLVKSCLPDPSHVTPQPTRTTTLSSLPDDLLLECLSRLPSSSLPILPLVSRRFSLLLNSPAFLLRRRSLNLVTTSLLVVSVSNGLLSAASFHSSAGWELLSCPLPVRAASLSNSRLAVVGREVYVIGKCSTVRFDTWTETVTASSPTIFPRKKFAAAVVDGKIYVAGGTARSTAVEEYDQSTDTWRVVGESPKKRYGCVGVAADGVFYVIGGLKIGARGEEEREGSIPARAETYASSMDSFDVGTRTWGRTRTVPGGGCVVGACGVEGKVYVLVSHAVEVSFWRWEGGKRRGGEWGRLRSPPVRGQVRVGGALRFGCVGVGNGKVAVVVHVTEEGARRMGWGRERVVLWYDVRRDEWERGVDIPAGFRRGGCVCVEC